MTSARQAAYELLIAHLRGGSPLWDQRVEPLTVATTTLEKPFVQFFTAANMRQLSTPSRRSAEMTISVKGVANTLAEAEAISEAITLLLDNSGVQDVDPRLPTHAEWDVLTVTEDRAIEIEEKFSGAESIYHAGHQYQFKMERR